MSWGTSWSQTPQREHCRTICPFHTEGGLTRSSTQPTIKVVAKPSSQEPAVVTLPRLPWSGKIEFGYDNFVSKDVHTVSCNFRAQAERTVRKDNYLGPISLFLEQGDGHLRPARR